MTIVIYCSSYMIVDMYHTLAGRGETPNAERRTPNAERRTPNAERRTPNAERRTPNAERRMQNAERRMHCLLAVSFTCVCLRLAFICWKGQHFIVFGPFQQIKANCKQTQVKLSASKQYIRRSAFYPCRTLACFSYLFSLLCCFLVTLLHTDTLHF